MLAPVNCAKAVRSGDVATYRFLTWDLCGSPWREPPCVSSASLSYKRERRLVACSITPVGTFRTLQRNPQPKEYAHVFCPFMFHKRRTTYVHISNSFSSKVNAELYCGLSHFLHHHFLRSAAKWPRWPLSTPLPGTCYVCPSWGSSSLTWTSAAWAAVTLLFSKAWEWRQNGVASRPTGG